jgi:glycosyltransferase involved in cell wall biosynthesis
VAETVNRSGAGALFPSGDSGALAEEAVRFLAGNLSEVGARGRAYVEAHHGWDQVLDRLFGVYRRILES